MNDAHQRIQTALAAFARGDLVIVADDDDRENEGDLFVAASLCTPEKMAFIIRDDDDFAAGEGGDGRPDALVSVVHLSSLQSASCRFSAPAQGTANPARRRPGRAGADSDRQ